jgi:mRNA interferase MazF
VTAPTFVPNRGDIVWIDFQPQAGHEQAGRRPALLLSSQSYNARSGLAVVCPVTNRSKGYPLEVALPVGLAAQGMVLADHLKSVDWRARRAEFFCHAPQEVVSEAQAKAAALLLE